MYIAMDMGTTNTRIWLCENGTVTDKSKERFGAKTGKAEGKEALFSKTRNMIRELLSKNSLSERDIECIVVSGMAGSEIGLCEVPHRAIPTDCYDSAKNLHETVIPQITSIPFHFVAGLKKQNGDTLCDIMRGEETEIFGILPYLPRGERAVAVLPGTHNKVILINEKGEISDFCTTLSGELLDMIITHSILSSAVTHAFRVSETDVKRGNEYAHSHGINAALFHVRVMEKNGSPPDALSSFLYGAVLGQDTDLIRSFADGAKIFIGGNERLQTVYSILLKDLSASPLSREVSDNATLRGLNEVYKIQKAHSTAPTVLKALEDEKLISIVRSPSKQSVIRACEALYKGGVKLLEVTFDRSGKLSKQDICEIIASLNETFAGRMLIGAGTVTSIEEVMLAFDAGAKFIISPNCDTEIIALTKKLGLVSIPAAYTATEIACALKYGADYVKLFPADSVSKEYVKAVKAPLSDAKLLAVGGITAENARDFISAGFCGVGVGSNLYDKKLIEAEDYAALTSLAQKYVTAVKG